jgi:hypothetical protein
VLAVAFGLLALAELACRFAVPHLVEIEGRREAEYAEAVAPQAPDERQRTVLVLGNSLLAEGVDWQSLRERVGGEVRLQRLVVESTAYHDWHYGLRRLLADGARPGHVILVLSPDQLASPTHRGDYSAYRLMRTRDAWRAGQDMGLSNTQSADLVISSASAYFGMRTNIRKRMIKAVVPGLEQLMPILTQREEPKLQKDELQAIARARLDALQAIASTNGVRLAVAVPPTNDRNIAALTAAVVDAGKAAGVTVLVPVAPDSLPGSSYASDGFHLSRTGAVVFTPRFADEISRLARQG